MKFLGIFSQQGSISKEINKYNRKDIEVSFEWKENTNKALLMYKSESEKGDNFTSVEKGTKGCFVDNLKFSDKVSIVAFDSSKKYINQNSSTTPGSSDTEFCREDQLACESGERCLDEGARKGKTCRSAETTRLIDLLTI